MAFYSIDSLFDRIHSVNCPCGLQKQNFLEYVPNINETDIVAKDVLLFNTINDVDTLKQKDLKSFCSPSNKISPR